MINTLTAKFAYNFVAYPLLSLAARLAAPFSRKLRRGLSGRRKSAAQAREFRKEFSSAKIALFHCASAGELEGVKPLAAACRLRGYEPCVTYFSPSAECSIRSGEFAFSCYSPFDSVFEVHAFYKALRPNVILISKHDVWPNMVWQANSLGIPIWLINGNFHAKSTKSIPGLAAFHRTVYAQLSGILTVSEHDTQRAAEVIGTQDRVWNVGDSRFDRVWSRAQSGLSPLPELANTPTQLQLMIGGSTHDQDNEILISALPDLRRYLPNLQLLIVPHDPSEAVVASIRKLAISIGLTCEEINELTLSSDIIIVNRSGILADVYKYGTLAYVGGGFDRGVHSVLEPMAHGLRVLCGPNIAVSREANEAREDGLLAVVDDANALVRYGSLFLSSLEHEGAKSFVKARAGVVNHILDLVLPSLEDPRH